MSLVRRSRSLAVVVGLALPVVALPSPAHAQVFVIPCNDVTGLNNAIVASNSTPGPDQIILAFNCVYNVATPLAGVNAVTPVTGQLTLTGRGSTLARTGGPNFRLLKVEETGNLTVNQLTLRGGDVTFASPITTQTVIGCSIDVDEDNRGGGILNQGSLTLNSSTVTENSAGVGGGIATDPESTLLVRVSTVSDNDAEASGGGIYGDEDNSLTVQNTTVAENASSSACGGGGVHTQGTHALTVQGGSITGNDAEVYGGGLIIQADTATLSSVRISGNSAAAQGGGLLNAKGSSTTLNSVTITGNTASEGGGVYSASSNDPMTVNASPITGNTPDNCAGNPVPTCVG